MDIPLKPEYEKMIRERVATERYTSATAVIEQGLRLLQNEEESEQKLEELRQKLQGGIDQINRGEGIRYNSADELASDIIRRGIAELNTERL